MTTGGGLIGVTYLDTTGHLLWNTDNTYDIGASSGTRPRRGYCGTAVVAPTGTFATAVAGGTISGSAGSFSSDMEVTESAKGVILKSPDGTRYRITVSNGGILSVAAA